MMEPSRALQHLLHSMDDAPCQAADRTLWGFSLGHVTLQQLQQHHHNRLVDTDEAAGVGAAAAAAAADTYLNRLEADHTFVSNHSVAAMAQQLGLSVYANGLTGTLLAALRPLPDAAGADAALAAVRQQIDAAWSREAVWRGVGFAKEGDYQQALECYDKALLLNLRNCDAYVARGAARANQRQFEGALQDFTAALQIDPDNANAAKYLQATNKHVQAAAELSAARAQQQQAEPSGHGSQGHKSVPHRQQQEPQQYELLQARQQRQRGVSRSRSPGRSRGRYQSRSRSRSRSKAGSSGTSSSSSSTSSSEHEGGPSKVSKGVNVADIQEAIQVLRSETRQKHNKKEQKHGKKKRSKQRKHGSKHGKHRRSKQKQHKSR